MQRAQLANAWKEIVGAGDMTYKDQTKTIRVRRASFLQSAGGSILGKAIQDFGRFDKV
jgi:hypothetical protein